MQIVKISGKPGSGKTELLSIIAEGSLRRNYAAVNGKHSADAIVRALRGRRDCVLTVDECSQQLLDDLERHPELACGGRVSRIYAVVDEPVVVLPRPNTNINNGRGDAACEALLEQWEKDREAIRFAGVQVAG